MKSTYEPISVFLVDDDRLYLVSLKNHLEEKFKSDITVQMFTSGEECLKSIHDRPHLVILDYFLNTGDPDSMHGLQVLKKVKDESEDITVIMLSAQNNIEIAVSAIKFGSKEYIVKCEDAFGQVETVIKDLMYRRESENEWLREKWSSFTGSHL